MRRGARRLPCGAQAVVEVEPAESRFLVEWHRIVAEKDLEGLRRALAPDIEIGAPPYWSRVKGRDLVHHLLCLIINTIEDFTYRREWSHGRELALEFTGHVGEQQLQAIDLISLNDDDRIRRIDVLMRPVDTVIALREIISPQMAEYIAQGARASAEKTAR